MKVPVQQWLNVPEKPDLHKPFLLGWILLSLASLSGCTKIENPDTKPDARVVVTTASFDQLIKDSKKPIVLDFWAS